MTTGTPNILSGEELIAHARDPFDPLTQAFGGVIARFCGLGLSAAWQGKLMARYFPRAEETMSHRLYGGCPAFRSDEFQDLVDLLLEHRSDDSEETTWLAHAIATAAMGGDHLYQDMGLPDRQALSALLQRHFTTLFARNTGNMKWKKFFYKQLCERAEVMLCKAPSCGVCEDYAKCFGPE